MNLKCNITTELFAFPKFKTIFKVDRQTPSDPKLNIFQIFDRNPIGPVLESYMGIIIWGAMRLSVFGTGVAGPQDRARRFPTLGHRAPTRPPARVPAPPARPHGH